MSKSNFEMVKEFHKTFIKEKDPTTPTWPDDTDLTLRSDLIEEEWTELDKELWEDPKKRDIVKVAKELVDLLYVVYGTAAKLGLPIDACFAEVHRSNMSKLGKDGLPVLRSDGKVLKGPNYSPADLSKLVKTSTTIKTDKKLEKKVENKNATSS